MSLPPGSPYASAPATIAASPVPTVADWNSHTDWIKAITDSARCSVYSSTTQSPATGTFTLQGWDSEAADSDSLHSNVTDNSRIKVPCAGTFLVSAAVQFVANATGVRAIQIRKNAAGSNAGGTSVAQWNTGLASTTAGTTAAGCKDIVLASGDYLEAFVYQNSGGALSTVAGDAFTYMSVRLVAKS